MIDDEPGDYEYIRRMLLRVERARYELEWTHDYDQGLATMQENGYAAYIVDYRLGMQSGLELLREARERGCYGPVIIVTGQGDRSTDIDAMHSGADDYLVKNQIEPYYLDKTIRYAIERNRAERLVVAQQLRLSQTLKLSALGELATGIAHEINNPLAIIAGRTAQLKQLLDKPEIDRQQIRGLLDKLTDTTDRMTKIVRTLRSLCRNDATGPGELCSVRAIVLDTVEICRGRLKHQGVRIDVEGVPEGLMIHARASEISQVLINLLCNAMDAVGELDERWVRVTAAAVVTGIEIRVEDSGQGIPHDIQNEILKPYFTTKSDGSGLGLSIVSMIIERHRGTFFIDKQARNTAFVINLPSAPMAGLADRRFRILVVDDDAGSLLGLTHALTSRGHQVLTARDGIDALDVLLRSPVEVLITDSQIPGIDGISLYRRIRAAGGEAGHRVIFLTSGDPGHVRDLLGPDREAPVLVKPVDVRQIEEILQPKVAPSLSLANRND